MWKQTDHRAVPVQPRTDRKTDLPAIVLPSDTSFIHSEYTEDLMLAQHAKVMIEEYAELADLEHCAIRYFWKKTGGRSKGREIYGACKSVAHNSLVNHFAQCRFIIWLAADTCRDLHQHQHLGVLYHELLHIQRNPETGKYHLRDHEFEGFLDELTRFGIWREGWKQIGQRMEQLRLVA